MSCFSCLQGKLFRAHSDQEKERSEDDVESATTERIKARISPWTTIVSLPYMLHEAKHAQRPYLLSRAHRSNGQVAVIRTKNMEAEISCGRWKRLCLELVPWVMEVCVPIW